MKMPKLEVGETSKGTGVAAKVPPKSELLKSLLPKVIPEAAEVFSK
jgi:hypothetical protein